jgi:hypothetical protein
MTTAIATDRYDETLTRVTEVIAVLRDLRIPPENVHSIDVAHWSDGSQVGIHINGESDEHRALVDRIGDHYGLTPDDGQTSNYARGAHLGRTPVLVFCGRGES